MRFVADVDLDQQLRQAAGAVGCRGYGVGQARAVEAFDHVGDAHGVGRLVGLQRADQVQAQGWVGSPQGREFVGRLLHAVFTEHVLPVVQRGLHQAGGVRFGDGDQGDFGWITPGAGSRGGDARADGGQGRVDAVGLGLGGVHGSQAGFGGGLGQDAPAWRGWRQAVEIARPAIALACDHRDTMAPPVLRAKLLLASFLLPTVLLAGCGGGDGGSARPLADASYADPNGLTPPAIVPGQGKANAQQEADAALQVNKYLWRGALETLAFMPFASTDPFGGVIVTDWYSPPTTTNERFKATAYVLGRQLRADGVHVTIFRQTREAGQWEDATVNPATSTDIEGKILARARELRARGTS